MKNSHSNSPLPNAAIVERIPALIACTLSVAACLAYARYRENLPDWWRENGGGVPYVVFWITFAFVFFPLRRYITKICVLAVLLTCSLEFLQLWQPDWLTVFRSTRFGAALLGNQFVWQDFPPYFIGGVVGFLVLRGVVRFRSAR